jgi:hypothetical protein
MLRGVFISLFISHGAKLIPVPKPLIDALISLEVSQAAFGPSGFQILFDLEKGSLLHYLFLFKSKAPLLMTRIVIVMLVNGTKEVIFDGVITEQSTDAGDSPGQVKLKIIGEDLTRLMDYVDRTGRQFPSMSHSARVKAVISEYAGQGIVPLVIDPFMVDVPPKTEKISQQKGKDLAYIKDLAKEVGYVFYLIPGPVLGKSLAYWGPKIRIGPLQPPLNKDMDGQTNVESLDFSVDSEAKTNPIVQYIDSKRKKVVETKVPKENPLVPKLSGLPIPTKLKEKLVGAAKMSPTEAILAGLGKAAESAFGVKGEGVINVVQYGQPLKPYGLITVRGAGSAYNGIYQVTSISHKFKKGEYKQNFKLSRSSLTAGFKKVPS